MTARLCWNTANPLRIRLPHGVDEGRIVNALKRLHLYDCELTPDDGGTLRIAARALDVEEAFSPVLDTLSQGATVQLRMRQ